MPSLAFSASAAPGTVTRDSLRRRRSPQPALEAPTAARTAVRLRIGVHEGSVTLLTLSGLGWLDEALFAEGVLVDWIACADGGRTAALVAAGAIELGGAASEESHPYGPSVIVIDSVADRQDALVAGRGVAERVPRLVATVLQAFEQAETWARAHPAAASKLLAQACQCLDGALKAAPHPSSVS